MTEEQAEPRKEWSERRIMGTLFGGIAVVIAASLIVGAIVNGIEQRERDAQVDRMVQDRLSSCFDTGDC